MSGRRAAIKILFCTDNEGDGLLPRSILPMGWQKVEKGRIVFMCDHRACISALEVARRAAEKSQKRTIFRLLKVATTDNFCCATKMKEVWCFPIRKFTVTEVMR